MRTLSPTLFWYIFKDLLKVFMLANGALAGILSFGGLLRPLTEQGLEAKQVGLLLTYFTPAMTAYSLPIAVLFATTVVYGRLSADNEILACRAGGLSHLSLALPAAILGLIVSLVSALLLLFIVPAYTLKVERVVFSNLGRIITNKIERQHQIRMNDDTVFARSAYMPPGQEKTPNDQIVVLVNPTIVKFDQPYPNDPDPAKRKLLVPKDFHTASKATIHLTRRNNDEQIQFTVLLEDGSKFPSTLTSAQFGGVGAAQAGPYPVPSMIGEDVKFKDLWELQRVYRDPLGSKKIRDLLDGFIKYDQQFMFLHGMRDDLNSADRRVSFDAYDGKEKVTLERFGEPEVYEKAGDVTVISSKDPADTTRRVRLTIQRVGQPPTIYEAREAVVNARPLRETHRMDMAIELTDVEVHNLDGTVTPRKWIRSFNVPMSEKIIGVESRSFTEYNINPNLPRAELEKLNLTKPKQRLVRELTVLANDIVTESNNRMSFAVSCLILTFVGCALGMMFRSGNFLTAFAVSFIPALIAITLIVAGTRVGGTIPNQFPKGDNPLKLGLALIWSGNAANLVLATGLWWRLQRK